MTKISFELSKNIIACQSDANVPLMDDSTAYTDTKAELWIDGALVMWHAVTDEGGYLEYTTDFTVGDHIIEIRSNRGDSADIHIDRILIDDQRCMPSQYDFKQVIYNEQSPIRWKLCEPFKQVMQENYLWWGEVYSDDTTKNGTHYRPHLVSDLGWNWRWYFSVKSDGTIYWSHVPDENDPYYDSTQELMYYLAPITVGMSWQTVRYQLEDNYMELYIAAGINLFDLEDDSSKATLKLAYGGDHPDTPYGADWHVLQNDSSTLETNQRGVSIDVGTWQGPGTYTEDLYFVDNNLSTSDNLANIVIPNFSEWAKCVVHKWYHASYPITPIQFTTV